MVIIKNKNCQQGTLCLKVIFLILLIILYGSCKKLVESSPPTDVVVETNVYSADATAIAVLNGIYVSMNTNNQPIQGNFGISLLTGLSADELTLYSANLANFRYRGYYHNSLSAINESNSTGSEHWAPLYNYIFRCNAAIEGLSSLKSNGLTLVVKKQLLGEAKFMRAFFYFYLLNLFGDVPLALTTDPEANILLSRSPQDAVYEQIISDLKEAEGLLSADYLDGSLLKISSERVRPTKWAATALLARLYLYTGDYVKAEEYASAVISNTNLYGPLPSLNNVFLKNSREAIWQLQPTAMNFNTVEAQTLVLPATGPNTSNNPVYLSNHLLNSFEPGDLRAKYKNWIDTVTISGTFYRYPFKYKLNMLDPSITTATGSDKMKEYFMVLRLGELYLIRAEARVQQNNIDGAKQDLNEIRRRAGLGNTIANNKASLSAAILQERKVELFTEWGHRWLDLKRTGMVDAVMMIATPQKSNGLTSWLPYQKLYPLPLVSDLQKAPNLVQNTGY
jgi:hypothetical protein